MSYCKHCGKEVSKSDRYHKCSKKGLLDTLTDPSFIVSTLLDNTIPGASLGLNILGSITDSLFGDDDDDDDDGWF